MTLAALLPSPAAGADSGSPSYDQGKQALDEQVNQYHVRLTPNGDLATYCNNLLKNALATGKILQVDSPTDFITGCQDEGRAVLAAQ